MSNIEMQEYIKERLPEANEFVLQAICDFLQEVEY